MGLLADGLQLPLRLGLLSLGRGQLLVQLGQARLEGLHIGTRRRDNGLGLGALAIDALQLAAASGQFLGRGIGRRAGGLGAALACGQRLGQLQTGGLATLSWTNFREPGPLF